MFDPDDLDDETAAYHEAGHALVAHLLGGEVVQCTIEDEDGDLHGSTTVRWRLADPVERARRIGLSALGGPIAEARFRGDVDVLESLAAWEDDWRQAQQALAAAGAGPAQQKQLLGRWVREVGALFADEDTWERLCRVADALAAHGTLDEDLFVDAADG